MRFAVLVLLLVAVPVPVAVTDAVTRPAAHSIFDSVLSSSYAVCVCCFLSSVEAAQVKFLAITVQLRLPPKQTCLLGMNCLLAIPAPTPCALPLHRHTLDEIFCVAWAHISRSYFFVAMSLLILTFIQAYQYLPAEQGRASSAQCDACVCPTDAISELLVLFFRLHP